MITEAQKYLIYGMEEDLELFCERAQKVGCLEFIGPRKSLDKLPEELQTYVLAMKELRKKVPISSSRTWNPKECGDICHHVLALKREIELLQEEHRMARFDLVRVAPFGNFSAEDVAYIEKHRLKIQFFCAKTEKRETIIQYPELIYLTTEDNLDYFISLSFKPVSYSELLEMRIEKPLGVLSKQLQTIEESIQAKERELQELAKFLPQFQEVFAEKIDAYHLEQSKNSIDMPLVGNSFFSIEVWVPKTKLDKLLEIFSGLSVHCERIQIEEEDSVPTILENSGVNLIGEDIVRAYDCPAKTDKDPSGWVFWFFALFFAMIVADAGYGLIYLGIAVYLKWKFPSFQGIRKRMMSLLLVLSCFVVGWGLMTTSIFGLNIAQDSVLRKISPFQWLMEEKAEYHLQRKDDVYETWLKQFPAVAQAKTGKEFLQATVVDHSKNSLAAAKFSDNLLLESSLFIGCIHVILSLLRYARRNRANVGWIIFLVGGYLAFPSAIGATSMVNVLSGITPVVADLVGKQLLYGGVILSMVLALLQNGWHGLKEAMNLVQVFGDVLSYLRLYALALAGAIMASTFNEMGEMAGILAGSLIIILGHAMNMGLGIMAGVIHGFRLNVLEWYHYSFVGGGRYFRPLQSVKLTKE